MLSEFIKRCHFGLNIAAITIIGLLLAMLFTPKVAITFKSLMGVSLLGIVGGVISTYIFDFIMRRVRPCDKG